MTYDPNRRDDDDRRAVAAPGWRRWLPWIIGVIALLIVLSLFRGCGKDDQVTTASTDTAAASTTTTTTSGPIVLPNGMQVQGQAGQINYDLAQYLQSTEPQGRRFTFENLHFATGSAALQSGADETIGHVAQVLAAYPNARVQVEGNTDEAGDAAANKKLSEERAAAVAKALIGAGVDASRVTSAAFGETNPAASNASASGRAENRRTDLVVTAK